MFNLGLARGRSTTPSASVLARSTVGADAFRELVLQRPARPSSPVMTMTSRPASCAGIESASALALRPCPCKLAPIASRCA
eukprot:scaffold662_cov248-Pinguiococcus_pyrenoidosus.AAC.6